MSDLDCTRFYIKENRKRIDVVYLDYDYIASNMMLWFSANANNSGKFSANVVVLVNNIYTLKNVNLKEIYYADDRLNIYDMVIDDIHFNSSKTVTKVDKPKEMVDLEMYAELGLSPPQAAVHDATQTTAVVPVKAEPVIPVVVKIRKELDFSTEEYTEIQAFVKEQDPKLVYDWVVNYDICLEEISNENNKISTANIDLVQMLNKNSDYINDNIMNPVKTIIREIFPEKKPSFINRMFGITEREYVLDSFNTNYVISNIKKAVNFDVLKFEGIDLVLEEANKAFNIIKDSIDAGIVAAEYIINKTPDEYRMQLHKERLAKMLVSVQITEGNFLLIQRNFQGELNRLMEFKDVTVPLLNSCLLTLVDKPISNEVRSILKNISEF